VTAAQVNHHTQKTAKTARVPEEPVDPTLDSTMAGS